MDATTTTIPAQAGFFLLDYISPDADNPGSDHLKEPVIAWIVALTDPLNETLRGELEKNAPHEIISTPVGVGYNFQDTNKMYVVLCPTGEVWAFQEYWPSVDAWQKENDDRYTARVK
tara:strand:- start:621 stop:971 length:351 start_codon:yes stop_codon:yes gene_type:complete